MSAIHHYNTVEAAASRPLSVALISAEMRWRGGEEQAFQLAQGLRRRDHICNIFARRESEFAARMTCEGFDVTTFGGRGPAFSQLWRVRKLLKNIQPDVLHFNDAHALTLGGLASWGLGIPARVASRRVTFPVKSAARYRWCSDRVICVSHAAADKCQQAGIPGDRTRVVHDGVDPNRVLSGDRRRGRRSLGIESDQPLLLCVASLVPCKGHAVVLDALAYILHKYPRARLAIAGCGPLRQSLEEKARRVGIGSHIDFLGYRRDIPDLMMAADLFVLGSQSEGLCSTLIDAMLAGRSIVTTNAGGIPDVVGEKFGGDSPVAWVVPPGNSVALAQAVVDALSNERERTIRQRRARERATNAFTADHMVDATLDTYREILSGTRQESVIRRAA